MKLFLENLLDYNDQIIKNWEEGVEVASQLLIKNGYAKPNYINEIITITNELGPYYVIAPRIALLHIRPNDEIKENAISFTYFKNPILFKQEDRYHVNFCLALVTKDNDSHMNILKSVAQLFTNQEFLNALQHCNGKNDLVTLLNKYDH